MTAELREEMKTIMIGIHSQIDTLSDSFMALNAERGCVKKNISELEHTVGKQIDKGLENMMNISLYQGKTMQDKINSMTDEYAFTGPMEGMFAIAASSMGIRTDVGSNMISDQQEGTIYFRLGFVTPPIVLLTIHNPTPTPQNVVVTTEITELFFSWRVTSIHHQDSMLSWMAIGK
jgi:hypothetical protein